MKLELFIYIYILFLLATPNFIFSLSKKITIPIMLFYSFIFTFVLYFTHDLVNNNKESFEITDFDINGINPFTKVLNSLVGENDSIKVNIDNDFGDGIILGGDSEIGNSPVDQRLQTDTALNPISRNNIVNTPEQEEKLEKNNKMVTNQYKTSYEKKFLTPYDQEQYNKGNNIEDGCKSNYNDPEPCCGQPGTTVSQENICSKGAPICVGYLASENKLGKCIISGGTTSGKVSVLGEYNMLPWSMKSSWVDKNAKWIWMTENADVVSTPNSSAVFQYAYFLNKTDYINEYVDVDIYIASDCYCYLQFKNDDKNLMEMITHVGTGHGGGKHIKSRMLHGENKMNVFCYNNSFENKPTGLLVTVTSNNNKNVLFSTDDSWTWYQTVPLSNSIILENTVTYLPIVALWNRKHKGFLMINANNKIDLLKTNAKKLNNTFECERVYFQYHKNDNNTISLYNCANRQYIRLDNKVEVSFLNGSNEQMTTVSNKNNSVSFYIANNLEKQYLSITNDNLLEVSEKNDDSSQWEMIYIDIINVGSKREVDNIPKYIGHVGITSFDVSANTNESFLSKLEKDDMNRYTNKAQIVRVDANYSSSWSQKLLLPGINNVYLNKVTPKFELIMNLKNIGIRQIVLYNNIMLCMDNNGIIHSQSVYNDNRGRLRQISNATVNVHGKISGMGGNMVIGQFNKKDVLFAVGPFIPVSWSDSEKYGAIYYRTLESLHKSNEMWKLYSAQTDGSEIVKYTTISYCKKNDKLYAGSRGKLYEINYNNGSILQTLMKTSPSNDYIVHPLKISGGYIFGINQSQIFRQPIDFNTNKLGEIITIANNIEVAKMTIVRDIIFALGRNDGKIYYVPLHGGVLKEFSKNLQGNLMNIMNYNDVIYAIDNNSNVLKTQIVL